MTWAKKNEVFKDGSVDTGDIPDDWDDQKIRETIRDEYLKDTTVTIVLVGRNTKGRKHVDWEIYSSMYDGKINKKSGIVIIMLPSTRNECTHAGHVGEWKDVFGYDWADMSNVDYDKRYPDMPKRLLDNIKKGTKVEQFYSYVANAKKAGLLIHACYMVGNQGESKESMQATLRLALKLNTDTAQFFPLIPYPGTEAYEWAKSNGYIETDYSKYCLPDGTHNTVLNLPGLSAREMVDFCNMARKRYYLRLSYILHRLKIGLRNPSDLKRSLKAFGKLRHYLFK